MFILSKMKLCMSSSLSFNKAKEQPSYSPKHYQTDYYVVPSKDNATTIYGTAQPKFDIYMRVALELFNKFVKPLVSYMRAHDTIS